MKNIMKFVKRNSLTLLSISALFVSAFAASTNTAFMAEQVKCPKELLK